MNPSGYNSSGYQGYPAQSSSSAQDVNPYYAAQPQYPAYGASSSSSSAPRPANAYEYDVGAAAQQSVYVPGALLGKQGGAGGKVARGGKRTTVLRKGAGKVWEDQTLLEWDSGKASPHTSQYSYISYMRFLDWFRLFVGDLSNDVSEDVLANAFNKYPSFTKAKVVRDRLSQKVCPCFCVAER